jgi:broad specificity phosphatase PhoE
VAINVASQPLDRDRTQLLASAWDGVRTHQVTPWPELAQRLDSLASAPSVRLWMIRHGETTTNAQGLITGTTDAPLTERGRCQARTAARALGGRAFHVAFSSHLERSVETLDLMRRAGTVQIGTQLVETRIAERHLGSYERQTRQPIPAFARGDLDFAPPGGGESYLSVAHRCVIFLADLAALATIAGCRLDVLVSSHAGPMRILAGLLDGQTNAVKVLALHLDNSAVVHRELAHLRLPSFLGCRA